MNRKVLLLGALLIAGSCLFPPHRVEVSVKPSVYGQTGIDPRGILITDSLVDTLGVVSRYGPPSYSPSSLAPGVEVRSTQVSVELAPQLLVIAILTLVVAILLRPGGPDLRDRLQSSSLGPPFVVGCALGGLGLLPTLVLLWGVFPVPAAWTGALGFALGALVYLFTGEGVALALLAFWDHRAHLSWKRLLLGALGQLVGAAGGIGALVALLWFLGFP